MSVAVPQIAGYRDLALIGSGGFSEVYRAWQEAFDRWVALKVMTFEVHDDRARERFRRECRTTGRFSGHPNVVVVHEADVTPAGRPYLAMQLYEGGSALDRLQAGTGPLPVDDVLAWTIQVAGALETGHRNGILHRDVKPGNILLTRFGQPVLSDFGLSILSEQQEISTGMDALTPNHAAPEVLERGGASAATDVYALASTTYMLLVGQPPHETRDGEGIGARLLRMVREPARPIDRPDVPEALRSILAAALSRDPAERPTSALELAAQLGTVRTQLGFAPVEPIVLDELRPAPAPTPDAAPVPPAESTLPRPGSPSPPRAQPEPEPEPEPEPPAAPPLLRRLIRPTSALLYLVLALGVLGLGAIQLFGDDDDLGTEAGCPEVSRPPVPRGGAVLIGDVDGDGCPSALLWDGEVLLVEIEPGEPARRYDVGNAGDQMVLGDWDCNGTATLGLYRPMSGERYLFDDWPASAPLAADAQTGEPGGIGEVVRGDDGCDHLEIRQGSPAPGSNQSPHPQSSQPSEEEA